MKRQPIIDKDYVDLIGLHLWKPCRENATTSHPESLIKHWKDDKEIIVSIKKNVRNTRINNFGDGGIIVYSAHCINPGISIINDSDKERDINNTGRYLAGQQHNDSSLKQHNINCIIDEGSIINREDCKPSWKASEYGHKDCTLFRIIPRHCYHESKQEVERLENKEEDTDDGNNPDSALLLHTYTNKVIDI